MGRGVASLTEWQKLVQSPEIPFFSITFFVLFAGDMVCLAKNYGRSCVEGGKEGELLEVEGVEMDGLGGGHVCVEMDKS